MAAKLVFLLVALSVAALSFRTKVHPSLVSALQTKETVDIVVSFDGTGNVIQEFGTHTFATRGEKLTAFRHSLLTFATESQKNAVAVLNQSGAEYKSFWINNRIFVKHATAQLIERLSHVAEVTEIREEKILHLIQPVESQSPNPSPRNEWGVVDVQAPEAWAAGFTGAGVTIATIDTGVRPTHETLASNYRADHGWLDPYPSNTSEPTDNVGHGTHCTGSIAGKLGIGVAPDAQWIACRGCSTIACTEAALNACGEWVACPTNADGSDPNCELAPHVSSNSWGGGQGDPFYNTIIEAWVAVGIVPVFAAGNGGPGCGTVNSPADQAIDLIAVGSTNNQNAASIFSSKGPSVNGDIKPDVCAPGTNINSAGHTSDTAYRVMSGTSMAAPHTAGVISLMLGANKDLTFTQVFDILKVHNNQGLTATVECGEISSEVYPNNSYGYGKVNALKAATAAAAYKA